jgi:hypothetical protein
MENRQRFLQRLLHNMANANRNAAYREKKGFHMSSYDLQHFTPYNFKISVAKFFRAVGMNARINFKSLLMK